MSNTDYPCRWKDIDWMPTAQVVHNLFTIMDKQTKLLFDRWLQREYPTLYRELVDTDSLHDAYIFVVNNRNVSDFKPALSRAYQAARKYYIAYAMRFLLPDPLFWIYRAMESNEEPPMNNDQLAALQKEQREEDMRNARRLDAFQQWVRKHFDEKDYAIFRMFYYERLPIASIAKLTAITKQQIAEHINQMCERYKQRGKRNKDIVSKQREGTPSTAKYVSICFRINKNGSGQIIPSVRCINYLQLHKGSKLFFQKGYDSSYKEKFYMTVTEVTPYNCTLHSGTRPYNLVAQNKDIVKDILQTVGAKHSATLLVQIIGASRTYQLDTTNPIKID